MPSDTWTQATNVDPVTGLDAPIRLEASTGAQDNDAGNADNWSQYHIPITGEPLDMSTGTMNLGNLAGDTLATRFSSPAAPSTINLRAGGNLKLNVGSGSAKINITGGQAALDLTAGFDGSIVVTADKISSSLLHANMIFASLTETGGSVLVNGNSVFAGTSVTLNSNLGGVGTLLLTSAVSRTSHLEVTGSVGAGITVNASADFGRPGATSVVFDSPKLDQGKVLLTDSYLEIKVASGVVIDSVSYRNDMLTLFAGNTKYASINVVGVSGQGPTFSGAPYTGVLNFAKSAAGNVYAYNSSAVYLDTQGVKNFVTSLPAHA